MKNWLFGCLLTVFFTYVNAQQVITYTDQLGRFWLFDNGDLRSIEHQAVSNVQWGSDLITYTDPLNQNVAVRGGKKQILQYDVRNSSLHPTRHFLLENTYNALVLYADGKRYPIAMGENIKFAIGDSILAFIDFDDFLKVFENGEKNNLTNEPIRSLQVSNNTLAYVTNSEVLNLYYKGSISQAATQAPASYKVGNNLVASNYDEFEVFDNDETHSLDLSEPNSIK